MLLFITFAIAIVELYINTTSEDVYLIIFLSVAGLCAVLGVVSSLLAWARVRRLRANPAPVSR